MFTCTQCAQCVSACETTQQHNPRGPLLQWVADEAARHNEAAFAAPKPERKSP
jgi:Fe-S-cluster-containing dehydrogenase component